MKATHYRSLNGFNQAAILIFRGASDRMNVPDFKCRYVTLVIRKIKLAK